MKNIFSNKIKSLEDFARNNSNSYIKAYPFPHIVIDDFFNEDILNEVLSEFPDLSSLKNVKEEIRFEEIKFVSKGEKNVGEKTKSLIHILNSESFLDFIRNLTGIKEHLISDPYLIGGGLHEIKRGGLLDVHADFNKHPYYKLDRRINILVYLNKNWEDHYGGSLELWDKQMTKAVVKVKPIFNRVVIFSTDSDSYHGHPEALMCEENMSRKSLALYYYTNGRSDNKENEIHDTIFKKLPHSKKNKINILKFFKIILIQFIPPIIYRIRDLFLSRK